jgi:AraC family transcriptional regulator of adaptative response / DNA-3-methyladenine glycosylase II
MSGAEAARPLLPPIEVCHRARESRDARFDGLFFTAVRSTRVYCRSVCPAPTCKRENVTYYPSAAAAQAAGYRPCLRCRPELAPGPNAGDDELLRRALALIASGFLCDASVEALAAELGASARHLRRRFVERLGASPLAVHTTQRLLQAKQFLTDTDWPIAQVAAAAGFASVRRFNAAFQEGWRMPPRDMRRRAQPERELATTLRLHYRPPFDLQATLSALACAAVPGLELVHDGAWLRSIGTATQSRWLRVAGVPGRPELRLEIFGVPPEQIAPWVRRVRRVFDLDADCEAMQAVLGADPDLAARIARRPGLRLPGAWDGFEATVAELLASCADAREALMRVVGTHGQVHAGAPPGLGFVFPTPDRLAVAPLEDIGVDASVAQCIRTVAVAARDGHLRFGVGQDREALVAALCNLAQLAPQRAQGLALRVLGDPDACPLPPQSLAAAARWRPWRAYAWLYLGSARSGGLFGRLTARTLPLGPPPQ